MSVAGRRLTRAGAVIAVWSLAAATLTGAMPASGYNGRVWSPFSLPAWPSVSGASAPAPHGRHHAAVFRQPARVRAARPARWRPGPLHWPAAGARTAVLERQPPASHSDNASDSGNASRPGNASPSRPGHVTGIEPRVVHGWQAAAPDVAVSAAGGRVPASVMVRVASRSGAAAAGVRGVLLSAARADGGTGGRVRIRVSYAGFAAAYGGAWSSRLRLVQLPGCALSAPSLRQCRRAVPLRSVNDPRTQTVTAVISFPGRARRTAAAGASGAGAVTLAAVSGPSGPDGSYTATPLKPTGTWVDQQGSFDYSYPFTVPPTLGGTAPTVALSYSSQSVDGETSAANTQAGMIGDGWDYSPGFIERSYQPCLQDSSAAAANAGDECWAWQNATLSLPGHSGVLVEDSGGTWHLQNDDGTTIQLLHNTGASGNGLWQGEYWLVTTPDGTKYYFGADHLPGGNGSDPATNSAWGVPVFCPSPGDPCYDSSKGTSSQAQMGWRWNLDYVVDPQQNLTVYDYTKETNYYQMGGSGGSGGTLTQYDRGGYPRQISYGWLLPDAIAGAQPAAQVQFGFSDRCTSAAATCDANHTATYWPDVPWDQSCGSSGACTNTSPTYWTTQMLTSVTTEVLESGAWQMIDSWQLSQSFPVAGDANPVIYLDSITHTGYDGSSTGLSLPSVSFDPPAEIDNRVDGLTPAAPAVYRPRIQTITTEAGAQIQVTYDPPGCSRVSNTMPSSADNNTMACFPVWWTPPGDVAPIQDWFKKSLVGQVAVTDSSADPVPSPTQVTSYTYLGGAAWHQNMSPAVSSKYRTWDQYRGFGQVEVTTGAAPDPVTKTLYTYMQGMDGDANADGTTKSVTVTDPNGDPAVTDSNWLAGQLLETDTYTSSAGTVAERSIDGFQGQWVYNKTADQSQPGSLPDLTAHMLAQDTTKTVTTLAGGGTGTDTVTTYYNGDGQLAAVDQNPQGSAETCTTTSYAAPPSGNSMMQAYPDRVTVVTGAYNTSAGACPAAASSDAVSDTRYYYDDSTATLSSMGTLGSLAYPGGLVTGVQQAVTWPSSGSESWQAETATSYDPYGRVTSVTTPTPTGATGAATTSTAYTPAHVAGKTTELPTKIGVTNPKGWITTTSYDQGREQPLTVTDPNGEVTTETYDKLGRLTSVTLPIDQGLTGCATASSACPTYTYAYSLDGTDPPAITSGTLRENKTYAYHVQIFDSLLQLRQDQVTPADNEPGRLISDTFYDSHGWPVKANTDYYDSSTSPTASMFATSDGAVPDQTRTSYDGMGRVLATQFWSKNALQWQTSYAYPGMNRTDVTPPAGGTATSTFTNVLSQVTASWKYTTATPDGNSADADVTSYTYSPAGQVSTVADNNGDTWTYGYDLLGEKTSFTDPGTTGTSGPNGKAGLTTWSYDGAGNVAAATNPLGTTLAYTYDILGRETAEDSGSTSGTKLATWAYDTAPLNGGAGAKGQLASATSYDQSGNAYTQTITGYDTGYQPAGVSEKIPTSAGKLAGTYSTASTYTPVTGLLSSLAYNADGGLPADTVSYTYLTGGLLANAVGSASNGNYIAQMLYTPLGQPERATFGSYGTQMVRTYSIDPATNRLLQSTTSNQTWSGAADVIGYTYDQAGNLTSSADLQGNSAGATTGTETQCYQYSKLDELTAAWSDKGGQTTAASPTVPGVGGCTNTTPSAASLGGPAEYWETSAYNLLGDRTSQVNYNTGGTTSLDITQTPVYPGGTAPSQPDAATSIKTQYGTSGSYDTTTIHYDADGDVTSQANAATGASPPTAPPAESAITYTPQGNTSQVTSAGKTDSYVYDASGNLILQDSTAGTAVLYLFGGAEQLTLSGGTVSGTAITGGTVTGQRYYSAPDGTQVVRSSTGTNPITFEAADPQHTAVQAITPIPGTSPAMTLARRYYDPYGNPIGTIPAWPDNHAYLGRPADPATSLDLLGARQYDPATGRFLSLDPLFQPGNPLAMGGYAYAGDNPATQSDPTGLNPCITNGSTCQPVPPPNNGGGGGGGGGSSTNGGGGGGGGGYSGGGGGYAGAPGGITWLVANASGLLHAITPYLIAADSVPDPALKWVNSLMQKWRTSCPDGHLCVTTGKEVSETQGIEGGLGMRTDALNVYRDQLQMANEANSAKASMEQYDEIQGKVDQIVRDFWDRYAAANFPWLKGKELVESNDGGTESGSEGTDGSDASAGSESGGDGVAGADDGADMAGDDSSAGDYGGAGDFGVTDIHPDEPS